jgi:hypothetical protein
VRHVYHLEPDQDAGRRSPETDERAALVLAIEAAVRHGVAQAVRDLVEPAGEIVPLMRSPARQRVLPGGAGPEAGERGDEDRHHPVPSYQAGGRSVLVPVDPGSEGGQSAGGGTGSGGVTGGGAAGPPAPPPVTALSAGSGFLGGTLNLPATPGTAGLFPPASGGAVRALGGDPRTMSITPQYARDLTNARLVAQLELLGSHLATLSTTSAEYETTRQNQRILQEEQVRWSSREAALGAPVPDCVPSTGDVAGEVFQFKVACDEFAPGEGERLQRFGQALPPGARLALHGYASEEGDAEFNLELSCHRANRASAVLRALPTRPQVVGTFKHGATPGPLAFRRSVWVEVIPPAGEAEMILPPGQPGRLDLGQIERDLEARATEAARLRGELPPYALSSSERYEYRKDTIIGRQEEGALIPGDRQAMLALQSYPSHYFPFDVVSTSGAEGIVLNEEYDLIDRGGFFIPPGKHPVRVTEASATSFTFTTLEGHFDPPGSTVTFTTWTDADGNVHLEQRGVTKPAPPSSLTYGLPMILAPYLAGRAWDVQVENLRQVLEAPPGTGLRLR